jgi:TonB family protein
MKKQVRIQLWRAVIVLAFVGLILPLRDFCQSAAVQVPLDAAELMRLAHDRNGLTGADIRPWHIRGTYHSYKEGKLQFEGKYEEWWFSPTKYKLAFSNPGFTQTDYANGTTLLRDGTQDWLDGPELLLRASLVDPLPDAGLLANFKLKRGSRSVGEATLDCVTLTYKIHTGPEARNFPSACFESTMPLLRVFEQGFGLEIRYDHIVLVQGRYIAHQIQVFDRGNLMADLNTESIEELHSLPEATVTPPATAVPVDMSRIAMKQAANQLWPMALIVAGPELAPVETEAPGTPPAQATTPASQDSMPEARAALNPPKFAQGTVVVKVRIRPDGHVEKADAVSGIVRLQQSALVAARQWVFRPFTVMGETRTVETELDFGIGWFAVR